MTPDPSRVDEPVHIRVTGFAAHARTTLTLAATDRLGSRWRSGAVYRADAHGDLDVDRAVPLRGDYLGAWGSGLVASMHGGRYAFFWPRRGAAFTLRVNGRVAATFHRRFSPRPQAFVRVPRRIGVVGTFVSPRGARHRHAVVVFGGSEGGYGSATLVAAALAGRGYPTLALAYFGLPGLPANLSRIPLEYFSRALRWLDRRPEVDPHRIVVVGSSRGSEAALLLGVHYPQLVHAVVAVVPSNVSNCSYPDCRGPAWTVAGKAIPFMRLSAAPVADEGGEVIPVERIRGPVLTICAGNDQIWPSCDYARAIDARLRAHGFRFRHTNVDAVTASHFVGLLLPYEPAVPFTRGGVNPDPNPQATEQWRERVWPQLLRFVATA